MSDVPGQSGHALPIFQPPVCATSGRPANSQVGQARMRRPVAAAFLNVHHTNGPQLVWRSLPEDGIESEFGQLAFVALVFDLNPSPVRVMSW
jgi:hypothetical protein